MPKISDQRREERRAEIVAAAMRCFARSGYQRTSMADIIAESGMSAGAIYGYFSGKQELLEAVAAAVLVRRITEFGVDENGVPIAHSPRELALLVLDGFARLEQLPLIVQTWGEAVTDPELRALANRIVPGIGAMLGGSLIAWARQDPGRVPASADEGVEAWAAGVAHLIVGIVQGFAVQTAVFTGFRQDDYLRAVRALLPG